MSTNLLVFFQETYFFHLQLNLDILLFVYDLRFYPKKLFITKRCFFVMNDFEELMFSDSMITKWNKKIKSINYLSMKGPFRW